MAGVADQPAARQRGRAVFRGAAGGPGRGLTESGPAGEGSAEARAEYGIARRAETGNLAAARRA